MEILQIRLLIFLQAIIAININSATINTSAIYFSMIQYMTA